MKGSKKNKKKNNKETWKYVKKQYFSRRRWSNIDGECQRLTIARALLMKTNIILFDEATSALDNETQANIQKAINNISSEYTMIIIAHRLSTIKDCNKIIVVDNGKVCAVGTHKELYKGNEIYKTLYENELQKNE